MELLDTKLLCIFDKDKKEKTISLRINTMRLQFKEKITDQDIDLLIHQIYFNYQENPNDKYFFDLTNVEYIGNQELLVLSSLFKSFIESNILFEIVFFKKGVSINDIPERVKKQIIQFWDVWQIWRILPHSNYKDLFGIDGATVDKLKESLTYYPQLPEIYSRYGITPFVNLDFIHNYDELEVQEIINVIYKLNSVIKQLLHENNCHHPFTSNSLSAIITEELYLNFLDHSGVSSFGCDNNFASMSISFQTKLDEKKYSYHDIQRIKRMNFNSECLIESQNFYYDKKKDRFKNISYIQFSFLDYGEGIPNTLREQFHVKHSAISNFTDSDVLQYAFKHDSSRHPINNRIDRNIPRGLFDTLTIAKRYKGLLIIRSNYGKILYDFSENTEKQDSPIFFGDDRLYFPGTLISLYIPAINEPSQINTSVIKQEIEFHKIKPNNIRFQSVNSIFENLAVTNKGILYSELYNQLHNQLCSEDGYFLTFLDFTNSHKIESRIIKKTIYFLLSDYDINLKNNIIITSLPDNTINDIETEIAALNSAMRNYRIHPLPIINNLNSIDDLSLKWLGVYNEGDKKKLNQLLLDDYSIAKTDFSDPDNLIGHLISFDDQGNLLTNIPSVTKLKEIFERKEVERLLKKHKCIKSDNYEDLYLCNGNYYQKEYIELSELISEKDDCDIIAKYLFNRIIESIDRNAINCIYIGITTPSQKILTSLINQNLIDRSNCILLDSYQTFDNELLNIKKIDDKRKYILICDTISTGFLALRLNNALISRGTKLSYIAVIANVLDENFIKTRNFLNQFDGEIISLFQSHINKYNKNELKSELKNKKIIRINPHTNLPVKLSINETRYTETVIYKPEVQYDQTTNSIVIKNEFIEWLNEEDVKIGFLRFNNIIHPYFFDTNNILKKVDDFVLRKILDHINASELEDGYVQIFYPRKSGIENLNFSTLKYILKNQKHVEEHDIERFATNEGWRFPHNPEYLSSKISENTICLVLDDGSCSGDSMIQMIDEVSFYTSKRIVLVSFIGRTDDHKRELFSRLSTIKSKKNVTNCKDETEISIYFVTHWHIPTYYLDNNPTTKEVKHLDDIVNLENTPQSIKKIAKSILREIHPQIEREKDYKYLPKNRVTGLIPKKELLLIREELGKVIGYRLYKESFDFFNSFFKKYENKKKTQDRYKEIELLCATFIYEPYLYDKITGILPDIVEQIKDFVKVLIFSSEKIYDILTYKWDKKDIIHLFFIVFKNDELIAELTPERFKTLITFTQPKESALIYILFKLLRYFPISNREVQDKIYSEPIKELLGKVIRTNEQLQIRQFYNFIQSLPTKDDLKSQLDKLKDNNIKLLGHKSHDQKSSFHHNVSLLIATIRDNTKKGEFTDDQKLIVQQSWAKISKYILPILKFSSSYKDFLTPYPYYELLNQISNLREKYGFIEDSINSSKLFEDKSKLTQIIRFVTEIQNDFTESGTFYELIEAPQSNLYSLITDIINNLKQIASEKNLKLIYDEVKISPNAIVNIPEMYSQEIIAKEISTNMVKYLQKDQNIPIKVSLTYEKDFCCIEISNPISDQSPSQNYSNGEGLRCLNQLGAFDYFGFQYDSTFQGNLFIQHIRFKIL